MLVLALAALIAAGCGGDDDDDGGEAGTTATPTQAETTPGATETTGGDSTTSSEDSTKGKGDDDADDAQDDDGGSLTRAAFIRRADKICGEVRPELAAKGQEIAALARRAQAGELKPDEYFEKAADLVEDSYRAADAAVDQLEDLPRPEERREALDRYLAATRDQVDYLQDQAEVTRDGDQQEASRLNAVSNRTDQRVRAAAAAYGFKVCGGGS
jgi:hypothetical protein